MGNNFGKKVPVLKRHEYKKEFTRKEKSPIFFIFFNNFNGHVRVL